MKKGHFLDGEKVPLLRSRDWPHGESPHQSLRSMHYDAIAPAGAPHAMDKV
jgi:hypothetical protein